MAVIVSMTQDEDRSRPVFFFYPAGLPAKMKNRLEKPKRMLKIYGCSRIR
jgi:hypothetical protein